MRLNANTVANGALFDGVHVINNALGVPSRITVDDTGVYNIQFSAQLQKSDAGTDNVDIWLTKQGQNVAYTNSQQVMVNSGATSRVVVAWNFMIDLNAGQYVELMWSTADTALQILALPAQTGPPRPAIPSLIVTVQQVR